METVMLLIEPRHKAKAVSIYTEVKTCDLSFFVAILYSSLRHKGIEKLVVCVDHETLDLSKEIVFYSLSVAFIRFCFESWFLCRKYGN